MIPSARRVPDGVAGAREERLLLLDRRHVRRSASTESVCFPTVGGAGGVGAVQVFVSHAHEDRPHLARIRDHVRPLVREDQIDFWDDSRIEPGALYREAIEKRIATADVHLLLISADFFASDFIATVELPLIVKQARAGVRLLIVYVRPVEVGVMGSLEAFQGVNAPDAPLSGMDDGRREAVYARVAAALRDSVRRRPARRWVWLVAGIAAVLAGGGAVASFAIGRAPEAE